MNKKEMRMSEIKELPNMLGIIASAECEEYGEYRCVVEGVKTHIVLKKGMSVSEIKEAVDNGKKVYRCNSNYQVIKDNIGQYLIKCLSNNHCIGLTWADEVTLNSHESDFCEGE